MSLGSSEGFKEYAQRWRDLAGRVQPPLTDRELVDMFLGTLSGPFFNHLIGNSSAGFTDLILTGERIEAGIKSGKIQEAAPADTHKKPYMGKKESNAAYIQKSRRDQHAGAVMISGSAPRRQPQRGNQQRPDGPKRQFTNINMPWSQALQHMLKMNLIAVIDPPTNPKTSSPSYNPEARCAYHSDSPGHDTEDCWALKYKIQNMIDAKEIEFESAETPNMITAPLPKHG